MRIVDIFTLIDIIPALVDSHVVDLVQIGKEKFKVPSDCAGYKDQSPMPDIFGDKSIKRVTLVSPKLFKDEFLIKYNSPEIKMRHDNGKSYRVINPFIVEASTRRKMYFTRENMIRIFALFKYFEIAENYPDNYNGLRVHRPVLTSTGGTHVVGKKLKLLLRIFAPVELK